MRTAGFSTLQPLAIRYADDLRGASADVSTPWLVVALCALAFVGLLLLWRKTS